MSPTQQPIRKFIIVIPGFMQSRGTPNGMVALWRKLHHAYAGPDTVVSLHLWNSNWRDVAEWIWRLRPNKGQLDIVIAGYSWGGYSAVLLARQLKKRGIQVRSMILSDPVYRHWYWLGQWRAFWPQSRIRLPSKVGCVAVFRQETNLPSGHFFTDETNKIPVTTFLIDGVVHQFMDDLPQFHNLTMMEAA